MIANLITRIMGSRNRRVLKRMWRVVDKINALEPQFEQLSNDELCQCTTRFRERLARGEKLDALLPEAFAAVREAGRRTLGMRHFDVQMVGGMALHEGRIAEMKTGEGKTLVATLAAYLNALPGKGVHLVTVNDYLASRDAEWMGEIYRALGMTVGVIRGGQDREEKREAYAADISYGTNNEFGFDYLRDNMALSTEERVQRELHFGIVDEVDSILIDEARTPLVISGATRENTDLYNTINKLVPRLREEQEEGDGGEFTVDEKNRQVFLTESGHETVENLLAEAGILEEGQSLYDAANLNIMAHVNAALRAHRLFQKDVHYIVRDGQIVIVDEFTGRTMPGRRWSEGLHQAIEAKEGLSIQSENQTLASTTFQNFFRIYDKLSGMTGTADTEAYEFQTIYGLEVLVIPTHRPMVREDYSDKVFMTAEEKYEAVIEDIVDCQQRGQPVLVGTTSIEVSEMLSSQLAERKIEHEVLNAKQHEREADIIAQAGQPGRVTIATNMAGRGTDIVLGGNFEAELRKLEDPDEAIVAERRKTWEERHRQVIEAGGLHIIGTERHESRRVDNQLRGRAGRQGDPGSSRFYMSLEDDLLRVFGSGRIGALMQRLGMERGEAIEHPWVSRAIENAQRKVEGHNFDIRKQLLEYDDVANDQRKVIYEQRRELLEAEDISGTIEAIREDVVDEVIDPFMPAGSIEDQWDIEGLEEALKQEFHAELPVSKWLEEDEMLNEAGVRQKVFTELTRAYEEKSEKVGQSVMRQLEKSVMLNVLDNLWREHLAAMDYLRQGIGLRGFAQKNPKQEYKREAFGMFQEMLERLKHDTVTLLQKVQLRAEEDVQALEEQRRRPVEMDFRHAASPSAAATATAGAMPDAGAQPPARGAPARSGDKPQTFVRQERKVGRNEPCPCGSGKKYKHCHGKLG